MFLYRPRFPSFGSHSNVSYSSAMMNPDHLPFCIDSAHPFTSIPLRFNQTRPKHIELLRFDFETNANETIVLSNKERNRLEYQDKDHTVSILNYVVKKPGLYRLQKVIDETKLEVQRRLSDTLVVTCPKGVVRSAASDKCLGDLSDLVMEIEGTPPLKIVYSRTTNSDQSIHHFQSIQPENFASPLLGSTRSSTLVVLGTQDISWGRTQRISVPLNESMTPSGHWLYSIDEIHDATGNIANFSTGADDGEHIYPKGAHLEQGFTVHERPVARLTGCDSRNPLMVAKGKAIQLPVQYVSPGRTPDDTSHTLKWKFSPLESLTESGDHGDEITIEEYSAKSAHNTPTIREPGLYTLAGVKSRFCDGEVKEPASCLLLNPPEPQLSISSENIHDKCAGNSIGLLVDLDLIGTPPFTVRYDIVTKSGTHSEHIKVPGLRYQLELKPRDAGHFKYQFTSVDDAVYKGQPLTGNGLVLEQDVKPPASAYLRRPSGPIDACIEEPVEMNVELTGETPFTLEYELIHDGKRKKERVTGIDADVFKIKTDPLISGGEYSLALASVQDKTGCKIFLNGEAKFTVRRQRPKASFGHLEGKHKIMEIEGRQIELPLRLTGRAPWTIRYRNLNDTSGKIIQKQAQSTNDVIKVNQRGTYEILELSDDQCPGTVDPAASTFEVDWLARPHIRPADTAVLIPDGNKYLKREVCEGDIDAVEINLIGEQWSIYFYPSFKLILLGSPPYHVKYQVRHKPEHGSSSIINKEFDAALGLATITMDTSKAGAYEYRFSELSDGLYEHDSKNFAPLLLEQKVNRKPSAQFIKPGQSYRYCKEELAGDEVIPIKLEGIPPFNLEVDIKHQSSSRPETVKIANIESNYYDFRIPHSVLSLGIHQVSVRKVRDSRGCQQKTEYGAPHVQVQVYDVPTIYPLESRKDFCVGERISYTLSGTAPFEIFYTFEGVKRKAKSPNTTFRRIAEKPGNFAITAVSDKASECKAMMEITKIIHEMPSVKISKGRQVEVDIHEGGEAEILFEFWGTPPFEFTYTRSTNARRGQKSQVLETRHEVSYEYSKTIQSSQEGTYEVVAIKDKFCAFSIQRGHPKSGEKLLQF
jgi:nucleoporin POM152